MHDDLEALRALDPDERAGLRCHARHLRARPDDRHDIDDCPEPQCVDHRARIAFQERLRAIVAERGGPLYLARVLGVSVQEAQDRLFGFGGTGAEMKALRALVDGARIDALLPES